MNLLDVSPISTVLFQWDRSGRPQQNRNRERTEDKQTFGKKTNTCKNQKKSQAAIVTVATNPNTRQTRLPERDEPASHLAAKWLR